MDETKGWSHQARSVEECARVLQALDARALQRRAERLAREGQIHTEIWFDMANRTSDMLDEAGACFTYGQYTGCILALATGVEHGLRMVLKPAKRRLLHDLIQDGIEKNVVTVLEAEVLHELKNYRNQMIHSDIDELAAGTTFQRLTPNRIRNSTDIGPNWETKIPESQDEKEISSDLAAEGRAGDFLIKVSQILHDIFARQSAVDRRRDSCE